MATYTLKVRRFQPESGEGAYWEEFKVDLDPSLSVLDGILQAKDRDDGSLSVRCSCRAAICGSCGMKVNGESGLGCKTQIGEAQELAEKKASVGDGNGDGTPPIVVEPMGNMPVIKDLITDMESTHWTKIRRVTPWLLPHGEAPEREYVVEPESMIDITQSMACIQCGACVSSCLSMEADPDFIGPAALAKAYRFVGDPRDAETKERLHDLAEDPHGIYDCTHCFSCIDACPKGVAPMDQIMRLRRKAGEEGIEDPNPLLRSGLGDEVERSPPRRLSPFPSDLRAGDETFDTLLQPTHVARGEAQSVDAVLDQIQPRADGIGGDHGEARAERLVDHDSPAVISARQDEGVRAREVFRQALGRLKALVAHARARARAHRGQELREVRLAPDQEQIHVKPLRHHAVERGQQQVDALPPDHLAAEQQGQRTAELPGSGYGEKRGEVTVIGNAERAQPGKPLLVVFLGRATDPDHGGRVSKRRSQIALDRIPPSARLGTQAFAPEHPAFSAQPMAHQPLARPRTEAAQDHDIDPREVRQPPVEVEACPAERHPEARHDPLERAERRPGPGRIGRRGLHVVDGHLDIRPRGQGSEEVTLVG